MRLHLFFILSLLGISGIAQTTRTWTGSTNTDWQTASNWSPSGIPLSLDPVIINSTTNQPVLGGSASIASLTVNSGVLLNLGSHSLTVSGSFTGNLATVSNGSLITGAATVTSCTFGARLTSSGATIQLRNNTFNAKVTVTQTGNSNTSSHGNTFNEPTRLNNSSAGLLSFGVGVADIFNDSLFATVTSSRALYLAHSSTGNQFNGYVEFNKTSTATSLGVLVGSISNSAIFKKEVSLKSASGLSHWQSASFTNCTFDSTSSFLVSSSSFTHGQFELSSSSIYCAMNLSLGASAQMHFRNNTVTHNLVTIVAHSIILGSVVFKEDCFLSKIGTSTDLSTGPLVCHKGFKLRNQGSGLSWFRSANPSKLYGDLTLENIGTGGLNFTLENNLDTIIGTTTLIANSGTLSLGGSTFNGMPYVNGNIELYPQGGHIQIGRIKHAPGFSLTSTNHSGALTLVGYQKIGNDPISLVGSGSITLKEISKIGGDFSVSMGRISIQGGEYFGTAFFEQTGSAATQGEGYPIFHKDAEFKCSGTGAFQLNYPYTTFTYHEDLILNNASGGLQLGYVGIHQVKGDVIFKGAHNINSWSNKIVLNGTLNQAIRREHGFTPTILRLEINKHSGKAVLETPIVTLLDLSLQKGELLTTSANFPTLGSTATITGGSDSSYVAGPISKIGTAAFSFPTGGNGSYAPIGIDAVASSCTFKASYIAEDPDGLYPRSQKDTTLGFVNRCGYWNLDRTSGTQNTKVTLGWSNNPCFAPSPADAKVVAWNLNKWIDKGNEANSGNTNNGNVKSYASLTSFPAFLNHSANCSLNADLIALQDTIFSNYLAKFELSTNQIDKISSIQYFRNNNLVEQGINTFYRSATFTNGENIKALLTTNDYCTIKDSITVVVAEPPAYTGLNLGELSKVAIFTSDTFKIQAPIVVNGQLLANQLTGSSSYFSMDTAIFNLDSILVSSFNQLCSSATALEGRYVTDISNISQTGSYYFDSLVLNNSVFHLPLDTNLKVFINVAGDVRMDSIFEDNYMNYSDNLIFNIEGDLHLSNSRISALFLVKGKSYVSQASGNYALFSKGTIVYQSDSVNIGPETASPDQNRSINRKLIGWSQPIPQSINCNLIPNHGFESVTSLPPTAGVIDGCVNHWFAYNYRCPLNTLTAGNNTPDLFSTYSPQAPISCIEESQSYPGLTYLQYNGIPQHFSGNQSINQINGQNTGSNYMGLFNKEQVQTKLYSPLELNRTYYLEAYISKSNCNTNTTGGLEFYLNNHDFQAVTSLDYCCQIADFNISETAYNGWTRYAACFEPCEGIENIANQRLILHSTYRRNVGDGRNVRLFVDDLKLIPLANAGTDKYISSCSDNQIIGPESACLIEDAIYTWTIPNGVTVEYTCPEAPNCPNFIITSYPENAQELEFSLEVSVENEQVYCSDIDYVSVFVVPPIEVNAPVTYNACDIENNPLCVTINNAIGVCNIYLSELPAGVTYTVENNCITFTSLGNFENVPFGFGLNVYDPITKCLIYNRISLFPCCSDDDGEYVFNELLLSDAIESISPNNVINIKPEYSGFLSVSLINPGAGTSFGNIRITIITNGAPLNVAGELIIDCGELIIDNSELLFSTCGSIRFSPNASFNKLFINKSYLHSCTDYLWKGIYLNGIDNDQVELLSSVIEDAKIAVHSTNCGRVKVNNSTLNANTKHIYLENCSVETNAPFEIKSSSFICNEKQASSTHVPDFIKEDHQAIIPLKLNYDCFKDINPTPNLSISYITTVAIQLSGIQHINIGTNSNDGNFFENCFYGVYLKNSNADIRSNRFMNIRQNINPIADLGLTSGTTIGSITSPLAQKLGAAIYQETGRLSPYSTFLGLNRYGGYLKVKANSFQNFRAGVDVFGPLSTNTRGTRRLNIEIENNRFEITNYPNSGIGAPTYYSFFTNAVIIRNIQNYRVRGFFNSATLSGEAISRIEGNVINNVSTGINISQCNLDYRILSNKFNNYSLINTNGFAGNSAMRAGVSFTNNTASIPTLNVLNLPGVFNNYMYESTTLLTQSGQISRNSLGHSGSNASAAANPIVGITLNNVPFAFLETNTHYSLPTIPSIQEIGIDIRNSPRTIVEDNRFYRANNTTNNSSSTIHTGVRIWNSRQSIIQFNYFSGYAISLALRDNNDLSTIRCNQFDNVGNNQAFTNVSYISGITGSQGSLSTTNDNQWIGNPASGKRIAGSLGNGLPLTWLYRNNINPNSANYMLDQNAATGTNVTIPDYIFSNSFIQFSTNLVNLSGATTCIAPSIPNPGQRFVRDSVTTAIQRDSVYLDAITSFEYDSLYEYENSRFERYRDLYKDLTADTAMLVFSVPNDSLYKSFIDSLGQEPYFQQLRLLEQPIQLDDTLYSWTNMLNSANASDTLFIEQLALRDGLVFRKQKQQLASVRYSNALDSLALKLNQIAWSDSFLINNQVTPEIKADLENIAHGPVGLWFDQVFVAQALLDSIVRDPQPVQLRRANDPETSQERQKLHIQIYPNPTNGTIYIAGLDSVAKLRIFDLTGKEICVFENITSSSMIALSTTLVDGMYICEIQQNDAILTRQKLLYQKN